MIAAISVQAQQSNPQPQSSQPSEIAGTAKRTRSADVPACNDLKLVAALVDRRFDEANDPILAMIQGSEKSAPPPLPNGYKLDSRPATNIPDTLPADFQGWDEGLTDPSQPDALWDMLVDCAHQTRSNTERAEALQVLATWEGLRADSFAKLYREAATPPLRSQKCQDLDRMGQTVERVLATERGVALGAKTQITSLEEYNQISRSLRACAEDSERLNKNREQPEALRAWKLLQEWDLAFTADPRVKLSVGAELAQAAPSRSTDDDSWRKLLSDPTSLVVLGPKNRLSESDLSEVSAHNRKLCDQIVTVAGLTPSGLALYIPPEGQKFMAKNAKDYPRMCLVQDESSFIPGVPRYLLVWAYSEGAFAGFQPVRQVTTSPVSGTGTLRNFYGDVWNFTYTGTMTEIDTLEAPYVLQSRSLYLNAYDQNGNAISQHSITTSSQAGGDASYAAGYNAGALISLLWNNPSHLIKSVLKDVQKDSTKYERK